MASARAVIEQATRLHLQGNFLYEKTLASILNPTFFFLIQQCCVVPIFESHMFLVNIFLFFFFFTFFYILMGTVTKIFIRLCILMDYFRTQGTLKITSRMSKNVRVFKNLQLQSIFFQVHQGFLIGKYFFLKRQRLKIHKAAEGDLVNVLFHIAQMSTCSLREISFRWFYFLFF